MDPPTSFETPATDYLVSVVPMRNMAHTTPSIYPADYTTCHPQSSMKTLPRQDRYMPASIPLSSPASLGPNFKRSSFSSVVTSEPWMQRADSCDMLSSSVKPANTIYWLPGMVSSMTVTAPQGCTVLSTDSSFHSFPFGPHSLKQPDLSGWPKAHSHSESGPINIIEDGSVSMSQQRRLAPSSATRVRNVRKLTTREDANFQCKVKGCGKLFNRSYNFKAHMETHDISRVYPFVCPLPDCNKKFVRKTDLQRHHQSVHMKEKNFQCEYCSRLFARKDTLRRHMEDGCSKRFDLEVTFNPMDQQEDLEERLANIEPIQNPYISHNTTGPPALPPSTVHFQYSLVRDRAGGNNDGYNIYANSLMPGGQWESRR